MPFGMRKMRIIRKGGLFMQEKTYIFIETPFLYVW